MKVVTGECSLKCQGACCRHLIVPIPPLSDGLVSRGLLIALLPLSFEMTDEAAEFYRTRGCRWNLERRVLAVPLRDVEARVQHVRYNGKPAVLIESVCPHVTKRGKCRLHGTPEKPKVCVDYPTPQHDLSFVPTCTYKVLEVPDG